jgi:hypothetical protein
MSRSQEIISLSEDVNKSVVLAETISGIWDKSHSKKPRIFKVMPLSWFWGTMHNDDDNDDSGDMGGDFGGDGGDGGGGE